MDIDRFFAPLWRDYAAMTLQTRRVQDIFDHPPPLDGRSTTDGAAR